MASTPGSEKQTVDMFLMRAIEKLQKNGKKFPKLMEACKTATDIVNTKIKKSVSSAKMQQQQASKEELKELDLAIEKLVNTFKLACESRIGKLMSVSLDCLQKLMAYGYIRGEAKCTDGNGTEPEKKLIDKIIDIIGSCYNFQDENVQLQIIKAYLTAVISPTCDVHENALMNAIRICYNIYLVPRSAVNQTTAKATLTQMLNIVFQRMVTVNSQQPQQPKASPREAPSSSSTPAPSSGTSENGTATPPTENIESFAKSLVIEVVGNAVESEKKSDDQSTSTPTTPTSPEPTPTPQTPTPPPSSTSSTDASSSQLLDPNVVYMDCFLIFRALCNLSMKEIPDGVSIDSADMRSKLLSLELLLVILETYGPVFRENERFITNAIKKYLCISILMNGVSSVPRVFRLSLSLFSTLIMHFKDHLKDEIGVFFPKIFLQILESPNSTIQQKHMVLMVLLNICKNPQTLVDIFLNYDCDPTAGDIFERMVKDLSQIAKGISTIDQVATPSQDMGMKALALECSVTILRSLVDWSKELHEEKKNQGEVNKENESQEDKEKMEIMQKLEKQRYFKQQMEYAKQQFNLKPKKAINMLISVGMIENSPEAVSKWLRSDGLDKDMVAEYLGDRDEFSQEVLRAYIDTLSFRNMEIDAAFRQFFLTNRLPKETQAVDRIILKFAEKYYADNPESIFANADGAYLFAYAVIMLSTDLHNPAVKKKMTRTSWKAIVRGQNDGKDFPEKFLMEIFDRILASPFRTADDMVLGSHGAAAPTAVANDAMLDAKQRQLLFIQESQRMVKKSQQLIKEKMKNKSAFFKSTHIEHVKPMFEMSWCAMLATLSLVLENTDDENLIALCMEGFRSAIHVASLFFLETPRDAFVTTLVKFTLLNNAREMKQKNIECIKTLIQIAHIDGNYLQESWSQILSCISQLEKLNLWTGNKESPLTGPSAHQKQNPRDPSRLASQKVNEINASVVLTHIDPAEIDRIFTSTVDLNSDAIVHFVQCLCHVSLQEINSPTPRIFSLQKIVEIAYFNMDRIRYVWSKIWGVLTNHFTTVGCDLNLNIAMYAIDSLRQLATKFLEKQELANYNFQKDFLKPFEFIITNSPGVQIRELIIRCLSNIILSRTANIKSGWKSMFSVFTHAASDSEPSIVQLAFDIVEKIATVYFDYVSEQFFPECCNTLVSFADNGNFKDINLKAIKSLGQCAKKLSEGKVCDFPSDLAPGAPVFVDCDLHLKLWWPILTGLARVVSHSNLDVRTHALNELFHILRSHGNMFDNNFWELVFRGVLLPMFDNVRYVGSSELLKQESEWLETTCLTALTHVVETFSYFFEKLAFLTNDVLTLLASCILLDNENLASIGSTCLLQLVMSNGSKWTHEMWSIICVALDHIIRNNLPVQLFHNTPRSIDLSKFNNTKDRFLSDDSAQASATESTSSTSIATEKSNTQLAETTTAPSNDIEEPADGLKDENKAIQSLEPRKSEDETKISLNEKDIAKIASEVTEIAPISTNVGQSLENAFDTSEEDNGVQSVLTLVGVKPRSTSEPQEEREEKEELEAQPVVAVSSSFNAISTYAPTKYTAEHVNQIKLLRQKLHRSTPQMLAGGQVKNIGDHTKAYIGKSNIQLLLIQSIGDILFSNYDGLATDHIVMLMSSLKVAYSFAHLANNTKEIWIPNAVLRSGLLPLIIKQEANSITNYLRVLFRLYGESSEERAELAEPRILKRVRELIEEFLSLEVIVNSTQKTNEELKYYQSKVPVVELALQQIINYNDEQFLKHSALFYPLFSELILTETKIIRNALKDIFLRIGRLHSIYPVTKK